MKSIRTRTLAVAAVASLTMFTAACGGGDDDSGSASGSESSSESDSGGSSEGSGSEESEMTEAGSELVGPGCSAYAEANPSGAGSVKGMSEDPVAVAAGNNPMLKTLTSAVSGKVNPKVDLVDTLNGDEFTVFAPVDDAFGKIDKKTMNTLAKPAGAKTLTDILTYHVVPGQMGPDEIDGTFKTANGEKLSVSGSGDQIKVGDQAGVICGGVKTANATVYLIDSVLMPPSMM